MCCVPLPHTPHTPLVRQRTSLAKRWNSVSSSTPSRLASKPPSTSCTASRVGVRVTPGTCFLSLKCRWHMATTSAISSMTPLTATFLKTAETVLSKADVSENRRPGVGTRKAGRRGKEKRMVGFTWEDRGEGVGTWAWVDWAGGYTRQWMRSEIKSIGVPFCHPMAKGISMGRSFCHILCHIAILRAKCAQDSQKDSCSHPLCQRRGPIERRATASLERASSELFWLPYHRPSVRGLRTIQGHHLYWKVLCESTER